jgi:hypothetical protein
MNGLDRPLDDMIKESEPYNSSSRDMLIVQTEQYVPWAETRNGLTCEETQCGQRRMKYRYTNTIHD